MFPSGTNAGLARILADKLIATPIGEVATYSSLGAAIGEGKRVIPMWGPKAQPRARPANGHPCSRAMVHMEWLVDWWTLPGETVVDPFAGSGTIPLASDRMQRHGIGIEISPEYVALAQRQASEDQGMFRQAEPGSDAHYAQAMQMALRDD